MDSTRSQACFIQSACPHSVFDAGDWKIDETPVDKQTFDRETFDLLSEWHAGKRQRRHARRAQTDTLYPSAPAYC
jgi:hypothetical protein